jgi:hypothetical protein
MGRSVPLWSAATLAAAVVLLRTVVALPQTPNSKSLGSGGGGGGGGQTSNNIDFTEERDAEDLRYKQVIQEWGILGFLSYFLPFCLSFLVYLSSILNSCLLHPFFLPNYSYCYTNGEEKLIYSKSIYLSLYLNCLSFLFLLSSITHLLSPVSLFSFSCLTVTHCFCLLSLFSTSLFSHSHIASVSCLSFP